MNYKIRYMRNTLYRVNQRYTKAPHIIFSQWCNDTIPEQRERGLKLGLELLAHSEELWVMGTQISEGMRGEIEFAKAQGIPTFHVRYPNLPGFYPISADGNNLLTMQDTIKGSAGESYENKFVLLQYETLQREHRTPLNQLWVCTHGPGCQPDYRHSDTIHLLHPVDGDRLAVARGEVWGIAKPETLERLTALYPELGENLTALQPAAEPDEDLSR